THRRRLSRWPRRDRRPRRRRRRGMGGADVLALDRARGRSRCPARPRRAPARAGRSRCAEPPDLGAAPPEQRASRRVRVAVRCRSPDRRAGALPALLGRSFARRPAARDRGDPDRALVKLQSPATLRARWRAGDFDRLAPRHLLRLAGLYALDRRGRRAYRELDEEELLATRSGDTAFVFGSGRSLVDVTPGEWE